MAEEQQPEAGGREPEDPTASPPPKEDERRGSGVHRLQRQPSEERPDVGSDDRQDPPVGRGSIPRRVPEYVPEGLPELHRGAKPGTRYARVLRRRERVFERGQSAGTIRATRIADRPRTGIQRAWQNTKQALIGVPLASSRLGEEKLSKIKALPIFASDALSSTAYATEEILLVLVTASTGTLLGISAFGLSVPISIAIAVLLVIVATSYRQTIRAYPQGGGAYKVAIENLGTAPGLIAGSSLFVDYTLTVAVSTAAGVAAITSAVPELYAERVVIAVVLVSVLTVLNLRGIRESGTIFAFPTYFFLVTFGIMIVVGLVRVSIGNLEHVPHKDAHELGASSLTIFVLLRAFSAGATALTGVEAISNGVPSFKDPSAKNAATTLSWMAAILGTIFISLTVLAHDIGVIPSESKTVVAQIADAVFNGGLMFYVVQFATALILVLAANTSFAGLPALASVMARDGYAPRLFAFRGDRLGYTNGIMVLAAASIGLLVLFRANQHSLIPLYAVGVFVGFTLSQLGMITFWRANKEPGWQRALAINTVGAIATGVVTIVITGSKFIDGAWLTVLAIGVLAVVFHQIGRHYRGAEEHLAVSSEEISFIDVGKGRLGQAVLMPIDELNRATVRAASYARTISNNVTAIHVTDDMAAGGQLRREWERQILDVPLVIVESEYRSLLGPVMAYVDALDRSDPAQVITVLLPEYVPRWPWQNWLHNQSSRRLKKVLRERPNTVIIEVPYHLGQPEA